MKKLNSRFAKGALALPIALAISGSALADAILIDPDGDGANLFQIDALDWNQTSTLSVDNIPISQGDSFRALTNANLGNFQNNSSNVTNTGLGTAFEWTMVLAFQESVTGTADPDGDGFNEIATFATDPNGPSLLEIWYDPAQNSDQLAGTGFNDDGGTATGPILTAVLTNAAVGSFLIDTATLPGGTSGPQILDQFNGDQWGGQQTLGGTGSTNNIDFSVTSVNNAFFPNVFAGNVISLDILFGNVSQQDPFFQAEPMRQLWDPIAGAYNNSDIGAVNLLNGPDGLFQSDFNSSFVVERIPEPSTIALLGLGLLGLGFGRRRLG